MPFARYFRLPFRIGSSFASEPAKHRFEAFHVA